MTVFLQTRSGGREVKSLAMILCGIFLLAGCGASRAADSMGAATPSSDASDGSAEYAAAAPEEPDAGYGMDYSASDSALGGEMAEGALPSLKSRPPSRSPAPESDDAAKTGDGQPKFGEVESNPTAPSGTARKPMLLYEAHLGMAVFRTQENLDHIEKMAVKAGGYLLSRNTNSIQVRVPVQDFEAILGQIMALGDVHSKEVKAQDVTAEFTDTTIRLRNAQVVRDRLEQLLAAAKNVEEALQVEAQLARVTDQIERMKGRLKLLQELAAFSTITVAFTERTQEVRTRVDLPFPWLDELGLHQLLDL